MSSAPPGSEPDLHTEIEALRAEVADLRARLDALADAPQIAWDRALGERSVLGLRWFGTLLYYALYPLFFAARLARSVFRPRRRYSLWENLYAAGFTWVYLRGKEQRFLARCWQFVPTFFRIRSQLQQA